MEEFSKRLKELRMEENLSMRGLAKNVGVSGIAISRWERCERVPSLSVLIAFCKYFKVSPDYLCGLEN